jgi:AcrR family transcriptional regulator
VPRTRERILAAADRPYVDDGLAGLHVRRVAAEVGPTPMALYRQIRKEDAIVAGLVDAGSLRWEECLAVAVRSGRRARESSSPACGAADAAVRAAMAEGTLRFAPPRA